MDKPLLPAAAAMPEILPPAQEWPSGAGSEAPPSFYAQLVWRYRWQIVTFVVLVTTATALTVTSLRKEYQATAILRIDPGGVRTVADADSSANGVPLSAESLILTEASEISSPAVILRTVQSLQLFKVQEFNPLHFNDQVPPSNAMLLDVAARVRGGISVTNPASTYLLNVSYRSLDPTLSATIANDLLQNLIQQDYETRARALTGASATMQSQLVNLGAQMEKAQTDLVQYESSNDVLNPDSANNIMVAALQQVNQDLGQARSDRIALQGLYNTVTGGSLDALMASKAGAALLPTYQQLQQDSRNLAQMTEVYGPNLPIFREQQALVQDDQRKLDEQSTHITNQILAQYDAAANRERLLVAELETQKRAMDDFNRKAVRYHALQGAADSYSKLYYQLQQQIQDATVAANLKAENLRVISPAHPIPAPVYPRTKLSILAAFFLSSLLAAAVAVAIGMLDRSVATAEQVEHLFRLPLLAALPAVAAKARRDLVPTGYGPRVLQSDSTNLPARANSHYREGILGLNSSLLLAQGRTLRTLAITSSLPGEGKSTAAANFAAALAGTGSRVVLVDADMRKPSAHRIFQVPNRNGLSSWLRGKSTLDQVVVGIPDAPNLFLITAGTAPASPAELLHVGLGVALEELQEKFDCVVFDCPPVLGFADALTVANLAEGCILVVHAGRTDRQLVAGALRHIRSVRANLLGIILNNVSAEVNQYYSYYSHAYYSEGMDLKQESDHDND